MEAILDELKQYNLKRIIDIENVDFERQRTLSNKYYLSVRFYNNTMVSMCVYNKMPGYVMRLNLPNNKIHLYEIEHNFEIQNIYDIFYNFINSITHIKQLYICLYTLDGINSTFMCVFSPNVDGIKNHCNSSKKLTKTITMVNLNELYFFHDVINEHEQITIIQVSFE